MEILPGLKNDLASKIAKIAPNSEIVNEITSVCSHDTIVELLKGVFPMAKFGDGLNKDHVEKYKVHVKDNEKRALYGYLLSANKTKKMNPHDITSVVTPATTHLRLSPEQVELLEVDTIASTYKTAGAVLGGAKITDVVAMLVASTVQSNSPKGKPVAFSLENPLAPNLALTTQCSQISTLTGSTPSALNAFANELRDVAKKNPKLLKDLTVGIQDCIQGVPVIKDGKQIRVKPWMVTYDVHNLPTSFQIREKSGLRIKMKSPYSEAVKKIKPLLVGNSRVSYKECARRSWLGIPYIEPQIDHVYSLHNAGCHVDSRILVCSADMTLINVLRANFGSKLKGLGTGQHFVSPHEVAYTEWDYIYYPELITLTPGKTFEDSMISAKERMLKVFKSFASGVPIFHINPIIFYCKEFAEIFLGTPIKQDDVKDTAEQAEANTDPIVPEEYHPTQIYEYDPYVVERITKPERYKVMEKDDQGQDVEKEFEKERPLEDDVELAQHYRDFPAIYHKLLKVETYTMLKNTVISALQFPCYSSPFYYKGCVLFGDKKKKIRIVENDIPVDEYIADTSPFCAFWGDLNMSMRRGFGSIFYCHSQCVNTYVIRLVDKSSLLGLQYLPDEFSSLYREEVFQAHNESTALSEIKNVSPEEQIEVISDSVVSLQVSGSLEYY